MPVQEGMSKKLLQTLDQYHLKLSNQALTYAFCFVNLHKIKTNTGIIMKLRKPLFSVLTQMIIKLTIGT